MLILLAIMYYLLCVTFCCYDFYKLNNQLTLGVLVGAVVVLWIASPVVALMRVVESKQFVIYKKKG